MDFEMSDRNLLRNKQLNVKEMPLVAALQDYCNARPARFHIPGHAGKGQGVLASLFGNSLAFDVTEVDGLDDLHQPDGCISKSQMLSADFFGADHTFYLVGGSSAGNQAMILATCKSGDIILMQRNVHQSLIHGALLAGVRVVWLMPETEPLTGMAGGVSADTVSAAFCAHPEAKALILQHPNYYGHARKDLEESVRIAHAHEALVLIDEAHGAHFGLHSSFPANALSCGADAVVQSTHKMLGALSMGAMLHLQGNRVLPERFRRVLRMLQTSSPSYLVMASLDAVRAALAIEGKHQFDRMINRITTLINAVNSDENVGIQLTISDDPCKLIIREREKRVSGYSLQDWFFSQGCVAELADPYQIVFVVTWQTPDDAFDRLRDVIHSFSPETLNTAEQIAPETFCYEIEDGLFSKHPMQLPTLSEWIGLNGDGEEKIKLTDAAGRICADALTPYPPGIPLLFPGEKLDGDFISQMSRFLNSGAVIKGIFYDPSSNEPYLRVRK